MTMTIKSKINAFTHSHYDQQRLVGIFGTKNVQYRDLFVSRKLLALI